MMDTKITVLYLFCQKLCPFIDRPSTYSSHLRFFTHNALSKIFSDDHLGGFTHNAMSKIFFDNTTMYGIPENPMIDAETRICLYYVENDMNLLLDLEQLAAILAFYPHCKV